MTPCLFAYGSLLTGDAPAQVLNALSRHGRVIGEGHIQGRLYMLDGYPGAVSALSSNNRVFGRVYRLLNLREVLRVLDEYEAYNSNDHQRSEFIRTRTSVVLSPSQKRIPAWVYWYNGEIKNRSHIPSGDYKSYRT